MKKVRHNIYTSVHRDLRTLMLDAGLRIQKTDFSKPVDAVETITIIKDVIAAFEQHVKKEDSPIFHAVASSAPYIIAMFEKTNAKNLQLGITIAEMADQFETIRTRSEKIKHGEYLQNVFFEFTATVLQSMNKEETVVNELLWSNCTDKEIAALEKQITVQPVSEELSVVAEPIMVTKSGEFAKWVDGLLESATPYISGNLARIAKRIIPQDSFNKFFPNGQAA